MKIKILTSIFSVNTSYQVLLTEKQCVYMLSAAFFCILPEPTTDAVLT